MLFQILTKILKIHGYYLDNRNNFHNMKHFILIFLENKMQDCV